MSDHFALIERNLLAILAELRGQPEVGVHYPAHTLPFDADMAQIQEYISVGEYGLAYEGMVCDLEQLPFRLSGSATVKLLEVGLLFGFKTDRPQDSIFDRSKRMD